MRRPHLYSLLGCVILALAAAGFYVNAANVFGQSSQAALSHRTAIQVVRVTFATLNADLQTGNFANLNLVYAPNAVLRNTNLNGVTTYYRGLAAIKRFWQGVYDKVPGLRYTEDHLTALDTTHVATREHAGVMNKTPSGRCAHLFNIVNGLIVYDQYQALPYKKTVTTQPAPSGSSSAW